MSAGAGQGWRGMPRGVRAYTKGSSGNIRIEYHTIGLFLDFRCLRSLLPPFG